MIRAIRILIGLIVFGVWAFIGLAIWIPMLFRMTLYFTSMVISSTFTKVDLDGARVNLDRAIGLYMDGFRNIYEKLSEETPEGHEIAPLDAVAQPPVTEVELDEGAVLWTASEALLPSKAGGGPLDPSRSEAVIWGAGCGSPARPDLRGA